MKQQTKGKKTKFICMSNNPCKSKGKNHICKANFICTFQAPIKT